MLVREGPVIKARDWSRRAAGWDPTSSDAARARFAAGIVPQVAAHPAGRYLVLKDGALTPVPSAGGGALAPPRPGCVSNASYTSYLNY